MCYPCEEQITDNINKHKHPLGCDRNESHLPSLRTHHESGEGTHLEKLVKQFFVEHLVPFAVHKVVVHVDMSVHFQENEI